jgi:hypothetical protein
MFSTILLSLALAFGWGTEAPNTAAVGWGTEAPAVSR